MADVQEAVRRLSIQATTTGVTDATKQLNDLAAAQGGVAVASASTERATQSLDQKFASIEKRYIAGVAAQAQYEKTQRLVNAAVAQNPALQDRANAILAAAKDRHDQLTNSQKALSVVTSDLSSRVQASAGSFGVVGQTLTALGPLGLAAAATIGTVAAGFNIASDAAHALADKAKELREFAEATGLTTQQVQALKAEAGKFGIDSETLSAGIQKFTTGFQQLRLGTGDLLTQIRRINPALADQIQGAQDAATAFTLFGKAVAQTDNIFQRNTLLKAGLGKGSAIFGEFFQSAPDVSALTTAFTAAGKGLDDNLIKKLAQLQVEIDKTKGAASTVFASIFAEDVLTSEKRFAEGMLDIAKAFKALSEFKFPTLNIPDVPDWVKTALAIAGKALVSQIPVVGPALAVAGAVKSAVQTGASSYDSSFHGTSPANSYSTFQAGGGTAGTGALANVAALTPDALAAKLKDLVAVLGSAASPAEKLSAGLAELALKARDAGVGDDVLKRAQAGLKFDSATAQLSAHNAALGASATANDIAAGKLNELQQLQRQGARLTDTQIKFQVEYARQNALGITQIKGQTDAENVRAATLTMSTEAATAYSIVQTKINEAKAKGAPLSEQEIADLQKTATAYAQTKVSTDRYADAIQTAKDTAKGFASDLIQGLMQGKTGMEALTAAAGNLASKLTDKALTDLFSGNFLQAGVEAVVAVGAQLFANHGKEEQALKEAQAQWASMADQVNKFNLAAQGVDLGPLTNEVASLQSTFLTLADAARKANDAAGVNALGNSRNAGIVRVVQEFQAGAEGALTPLQDAIKKVNDEAVGLKSTINGIGQFDTDQWIDAAAKQQIKNLMSQFTDSLVSGLQQRINNDAGKSYLNDAAALLKQRQTDLANAADLGNDPAIIAQISAAFDADAQKIVNDAGLVGDSFSEFTKLFPDFNGVVTQSATALEAANEKFAAFAKTINDYLAQLQTGSNSILSPQDQLAAAQGNFSQQLALAQSGNVDAQGSITQYASTLLDQAKSYYASSSGYSDIYRAVTSALAGLVGSSALDLGSSPSLVSGAALPNLGVAGMPQVSSAPRAASNDNGQHFANQTQTLVQAIASSVMAQISAEKDNTSDLAARLDRIAKAVEGNRPKPLRPAAKTA